MKSLNAFSDLNNSPSLNGFYENLGLISNNLNIQSINQVKNFNHKMCTLNQISGTENFVNN